MMLVSNGDTQIWTKKQLSTINKFVEKTNKHYLEDSARPWDTSLSPTSSWVITEYLSRCFARKSATFRAKLFLSLCLPLFGIYLSHNDAAGVSRPFPSALQPSPKTWLNCAETECGGSS